MTTIVGWGVIFLVAVVLFIIRELILGFRWMSAVSTPEPRQHLCRWEVVPYSPVNRDDRHSGWVVRWAHPKSDGSFFIVRSFTSTDLDDAYNFDMASACCEQFNHDRIPPWSFHEGQDIPNGKMASD